MTPWGGRTLPRNCIAPQYDARGLVQAELQMHYGYRTTYLYNARPQR